MTLTIEADSVERAWRDPIYRDRLDNAVRELVPEHPAGQAPEKRDIARYLTVDSVNINMSPSIDCLTTSGCFTSDICECERRTACSASNMCCV